MFGLRDGALRPQIRAAAQWDPTTHSVLPPCFFTPTSEKFVQTLQSCVSEVIVSRRPALNIILLWCLWSSGVPLIGRMQSNAETSFQLIILTCSIYLAEKNPI